MVVERGVPEGGQMRGVEGLWRGRGSRELRVIPSPGLVVEDDGVGDGVRGVEVVLVVVGRRLVEVLVVGLVVALGHLMAELLPAEVPVAVLHRVVPLQLPDGRAPARPDRPAGNQIMFKRGSTRQTEHCDVFVPQKGPSKINEGSTN